MMEQPRERPARRLVRDTEEQEHEIGSAINDLVREVSNLDVKVRNQEAELQSKRDSYVGSKDRTKQKVAYVFQQLKRLLEEKERETLDNVEDVFESDALAELDSTIGTIPTEKSRLNRMLKNNAEEIRTRELNCTLTPLAPIKSAVLRRDRILNTNYEPQVNDDVSFIRDVLQQWKCISDGPAIGMTAPQSVGDERISNDIPSESHESEASIDRRGNDYNEEGADAIVDEDGVVLDSRCSEGNEDAVFDSSVGNASASSVQGATANPPSVIALQPTAPALSLNTGETPEDPPPYWQAVGLSGPQDTAESANNPAIPDLNLMSYPDRAPRYFDVISSVPEQRSTGRPSNSLKQWHSFPSRRQFDQRSTLPVGLTWDHGKIALADRGNRKVKFFNCSGRQLLGEIAFNGEIHDVSFLEMVYDEHRYIVSLAKANTYCIVSLMANNTTHLVRSLHFKNCIPYNCISRGPREQTLVAGSGLPSNTPPCVDLIDYDGVVIHRFKLTPNSVPFAFPKSVTVFRQFIIIADYALNVVCVFASDGSPVGQYSGIPSSSLVDPLDITTDHFGNIMILHGKMPTIHVVDLKGSPIEVIKIPTDTNDIQSVRYFSFDTELKKLICIKTSGQIVIYDFYNGYRGVPQSEIPEPIPESREPVVLPTIQGMLPSTIENMRSRPRPRGRTGQFHL